MIKWIKGAPHKKQADKVEIICRVSKLTIFEFYCDLSLKKFKLVVLNLGVKN